MEWTKEIKDKIEKLNSKYTSIGQDLPAYLDGLLYANPLHYWDYAYVDTLLSLQHPKTDFSRRTDIYHLSPNYRVILQVSYA